MQDNLKLIEQQVGVSGLGGEKLKPVWANGNLALYELLLAACKFDAEEVYYTSISPII